MEFELESIFWFVVVLDHENQVVGQLQLEFLLSLVVEWVEVDVFATYEIEWDQVWLRGVNLGDFFELNLVLSRLLQVRDEMERKFWWMGYLAWVRLQIETNYVVFDMNPQNVTMEANHLLQARLGLVFCLEDYGSTRKELTHQEVYVLSLFEGQTCSVCEVSGLNFFARWWEVINVFL